MVIYPDIETSNHKEIPIEVLNDFLHLARGDHHLIEEALKACLEQHRETWWKFWQTPKWSIDSEKVIEYIQERVKAVDDIELQDIN